MTRFLRHLNFMTQWPIWLKVLAGLVVTLVVAVVVVLWTVLVGVREIGLSNVESFIAENGNRHRAVISEALNHARAELTEFASNPVFNDQMSSLLLSEIVTIPPLPVATPEQVRDAMRETLMEHAPVYYDSVRLLNREGERLVVALAPGLTSDPSGVFENLSGTYRALVQAPSAGQTQVLTTFRRAGRPAIEMGNVMTWHDGTVIGYVIATIDVQRAIYEPLAVRGDIFPAFSFLVSGNDVIYSPEETRTQADAQAAAEVIQRARQGETGVHSYLPADGSGQTLVAYHAQITNSPFVLVTQGPSDTVYQRMLDYLSVQSFPLVVGSVVLLVVLVLLFQQSLGSPLAGLRQAIQAMAGGDFSPKVDEAQRGDEIGALAASFVDMRDQVRRLVETLEQRIALRMRDIGTTQEIGRFAATQRDLQTLLDQVVNLIVERFPNIYHAQIFLVDPNRQYAVLRASTGDVGQRLLARGHRLAVGSISVIGQVTDQGDIVITRDTTASAVHARNEFLPETRAELAIPLRVGESVIGALDVQSKLSGTFNEDEIAVLQTMADQIAVAIENARLYQESLRRLDEIERSQRLVTAGQWREYLLDQRIREITGEAGKPTETHIAQLRADAINQGKIIVGDVTDRDTIPVAVPIRLRGQILGSVEWELPAQEFNHNKVLLAQELVDRLAVSLDNARLFQESRRAAERERMVNTIAARLTEHSSIDDILQTAVREVGRALGAPQVSIHLHRANGSSDSDGEPGDNGSPPSDEYVGNGSGEFEPDSAE